MRKLNLNFAANGFPYESNKHDKCAQIRGKKTITTLSLFQGSVPNENKTDLPNK